ncbi:MAG: helix-turn-helix domain-containing protein [Clostridiales bacterium]|nr:helix-turn-helix domain-containing protein [Clostridiales bacterium]
MEEDIRANYYAIIPAYIRYNKELKFGERLMYGEITALSNKSGYCYASNKYFADLYGVSQSTISRWISHLAELNSIDVQIIRNEKKEIIERRLYITDTPYMQNCTYPYTQNNQYPIRKKSKENIINNNMLDSLFNYIIKKEKQIPKEFLNYELQILELLNKYELIYTQDTLQYMRNENIEKVKVICYSLAMLEKENVSYLLSRMNREQIFSLYDECKLREQEYMNTDNEIMSFTNYFYKSLKGQLLKSKGSSFFMPKNNKLESESFDSEEDEDEEER